MPAVFFIGFLHQLRQAARQSSSLPIRKWAGFPPSSFSPSHSPVSWSSGVAGHDHSVCRMDHRIGASISSRWFLPPRSAFCRGVATWPYRAAFRAMAADQARNIPNQLCATNPDEDVALRDSRCYNSVTCYMRSHYEQLFRWATRNMKSSPFWDGGDDRRRRAPRGCPRVNRRTQPFAPCCGRLKTRYVMHTVEAGTFIYRPAESADSAAADAVKGTTVPVAALSNAPVRHWSTPHSSNPENSWRLPAGSSAAPANKHGRCHQRCDGSPVAHSCWSPALWPIAAKLGGSAPWC